VIEADFRRLPDFLARIDANGAAAAAAPVPAHLRAAPANDATHSEPAAAAESAEPQQMRLL
jgi:hypothetical protein